MEIMRVRLVVETTHSKVNSHMALLDAMKRKVKYYCKAHEETDCYDSLVKHSHLFTIL